MRSSGHQALGVGAIQGGLLVGYMCFVVYGSLVPLHYVDRPLMDALQAFQHTPWLSLGAPSRADWVSNGVLYLPVGYLVASWLATERPTVPVGLLGLLALLLSVVLAVSVEFAQLFFPQRTVSLNDLLAECLGSGVGILLAIQFKSGLTHLIESFFRDPEQLKVHLLGVYVLAYLALAFFPFDLLLTHKELASKINSNLWGWWLADPSPGLVPVGLRLLSEVLLVMPLGAFMGRYLLRRKSALWPALFMGLWLGVLVELGQFFIYSGVSQGLSVLAKCLGVVMGLGLYQHRPRGWVDALAKSLQRYRLGFFVGYVFMLLLFNGGLGANWQSWERAAHQLATVNFLPFYYQYFTTEAKALVSVMAVSLSYAPLGLLAWAHRWQPMPAACAAMVLATVMEAGKLFKAGLHPDPTNVLLAGLAGWVTLLLLRQMYPLPGTPGRGKAAGQELVTWVGKYSYLAIMAACVLLWLSEFPVLSGFVLGVLVLAGTLVWFWPVAALAIIPTALPVFDLAHWSGRFFLDEFDALFGVCLGMAFARLPRAKPVAWGAGGLPAALAMLLLISFAISAARGLMPLQWPDQNAFNNYYSSFNAIRIFKGVLWGLLTWLLHRRLVALGVDARRPFAAGMVAGLGLTVAFIFWERAAFSGLGDFTVSFRVTGPFSAMHTGGAYIECFLAVATPFLLMFILESRHLVARLAGLALLLASTYCLMVTFSRSGYVAFALSVLLVLLMGVANARRLAHASAMAGVLGGTMLLVAMPVFTGDFAQARLATIKADFAVHRAHWAEALQMRDTDGLTQLLGMGLGSYPRTNYWRSTEAPHAGSYRLAQADGNLFLSLGSGSALYVDQLVAVDPGQVYRLTLDVRSHVPDAEIRLPVCEKWMLTSFDCAWQTVPLGAEFGAWRRIETRIDTRQMTLRHGLDQRPVKLSLFNPTPRSVIDVDNVRLQTPQGIDLIHNGDFSSGLDHWFFATDSHLQWHVKSLFYGVLFDQGWLGLASLLAVLLLAWVRAAKQAYGGDAVAGAYLAALSGFLVLGLFDSLIDAPRFLWLLLVLTGGCMATPGPSKRMA